MRQAPCAPYPSCLFPLSSTMQTNDAYCGPASTVTVLNSLGVDQPLQPDESGLDTAAFAYYTQENVFDAETERVKRKADIREQV